MCGTAPYLSRTSVKMSHDILHLMAVEPIPACYLKEQCLRCGLLPKRRYADVYLLQPMLRHSFVRTIAGTVGKRVSKDTPPTLFYLTVIDGLYGLQSSACVGDIGHCRGVYFLEQRYDLQAELVACGISLKVCAVGDPRLLSGIKELHYLLAAHVEQRSNDAHLPSAPFDSTLRLHPRKSMDARSTDKVHQQCLSLVVAVVCHTDAVGTEVAGQIKEIAVPQVPCRRLNALMVHLREGHGVEMSYMQRYAVSAAEVA